MKDCPWRPHLLGSPHYYCNLHASRNSDTPAHNLRTPSPTTGAPPGCSPYLRPTPAVVRVSLRRRPAAVRPLAIVAISRLCMSSTLPQYSSTKHHHHWAVTVCRIPSTLQRRDETMLCAVLPSTFPVASPEPCPSFLFGTLAASPAWLTIVARVCSRICAFCLCRNTQEAFDTFPGGVEKAW